MLPTSRNTNYGAASPVKSADLNAMQDAIIAAQHGQITRIYHGSSFVPTTGSGALSYSAAQGVSATPLDVVCDLNLPVGSRIIAIRIFMVDVAGTKQTANFRSSDNAGGGAIIASSPQSAGSGANQTLAINAGPTVLLASHSYAVEVLTTTGAGFSKVFSMEVDYDKPT